MTVTRRRGFMEGRAQEGSGYGLNRSNTTALRRENLLGAGAVPTTESTKNNIHTKKGSRFLRRIYPYLLTTTMAIKELLLKLTFHPGDEEALAYVEVSESDTFRDVRRIIAEDLDEDMVAEDLEYYFKLDGVRLSSKQEQRKKAWDTVGRNVVSLHDKNVANNSNNKRPAASQAPPGETALKRARTDNNKDDCSTPLRPVFAKKLPETSYTKILADPTTMQSQSVQDTAAVARKVTPPVETTDKDTIIASTTSKDNHVLVHSDVELPQKRPVQQPTVGATSTGATALCVPDACQSVGILAGFSNPLSNDDNDQVLVVDDDDEEESSPGVEKETMEISTIGEQNDAPRPVPVKSDKSTLKSPPIKPMLTNKQHQLQDSAVNKSKQVLQNIQGLLNDKPLFCSEQRRKEWSEEIQSMIKNDSAPQTIIGVLGGTGVGKSSLLNALLDEAAVLPTSGSRGCT